MKKFIIAAFAAFCLSGCVVYTEPYNPNYRYGNIVFCDDFGCRVIEGARYYEDASGTIYYWDVHFGVWIGPHGYWRGGSFYRGYHPGYHGYYGHGSYGGSHGAYRGGSSRHGGRR